jgi:hypothetical protein
MLQELEMFAYVTSLDLNMDYYTIRLHPDSKTLCTIAFWEISVFKTTNGNIMLPRCFSRENI